MTFPIKFANRRIMNDLILLLSESIPVVRESETVSGNPGPYSISDSSQFTLCEFYIYCLKYVNEPCSNVSSGCKLDSIQYMGWYIYRLAS